MDKRTRFTQLFRTNPAFEAWLPVTLICPPMILLGLGFLWVGKTQRHLVAAEDAHTTS